MKFKKIILIVALSIHSFTGIMNAEIQKTDQPVLEPFTQKEEKKLVSTKKALTFLFDTLLKCAQITEELAMRVSNNQIKQLTSKKETVTILSQLRELISQLQESTTQYIQMSDAFLLQKSGIPQENKSFLFSQFRHIIFATEQLCEGIATYLDNAIKTTLKDLKPFDPELYITKGDRLDTKKYTTQELQTKFDSTTKKINSINSNINSIGLTWYNKATRLIDTHLVSPVNHYHIPTIVGVTALALGTTALITWKYGNHTVEKEYFNMLLNKYDPINKEQRIFINDQLTKIEQNLPETSTIAKMVANGCAYLRQKLGAPIADFILNENHPDHPESPTVANNGLFPTIDFGLSQIYSNRDPIPMLLGTALVGSSLSAWNNKIKPWIDIKANKTWNSLLGGIYEDNFIKGYWDYTPHVTFDNMIGLDYVKEELKQIIFYLEDPAKMAAIALEAEKGWLLTGKSRAGKSFSIECLCGEIERKMPGKYKFWKLDAASVKYCGIKAIFEMAKEQGPVILYIDEIHLLLEDPTDDTTRTLLHDFLNTMQSTLEGNRDSAKPVILFTATNKEWLLPDAVRNNGRLGKEIRIEFPNLEERKTYIIHELRKKALNPANFDINSLALKTNEQSFESISRIIRNATYKALINSTPLTHEILEDSLNSEIRDIILDDRKDLPLHEKEILASHFAGRSLCLILLNTNITLDTVTIKGLKTDTKNNYDPKAQLPSTTYGALITKSLHDTIHMSSRNDIIGEIKTLLAGFAAEEIMLGSCGYKCHPEYRANAYDLARGLVFEGIDPQSLSKKMRDQKLDEAFTMLETCRREVSELLEKNRKMLEIITNILLNKGIITDSDMNYLSNLTDAEIETISNLMNKEKEKSSQPINKDTITPISA